MKDCRGRKGKLYYDEVEYMKFKISKGQRVPYDYFIAKRLICLPRIWYVGQHFVLNHSL